MGDPQRQRAKDCGAAGKGENAGTLVAGRQLGRSSIIPTSAAETAGVTALHLGARKRFPVRESESHRLSPVI